MTTHANLCGAAKTRVVSANTWHMHWFLRRAFFDDPYVIWHVSAQGYAIWGCRCCQSPFRGTNPPKNKIWGACIGFFRPNVAKYWNLHVIKTTEINSNQILHNTKDHQVLIVSCSNKHATNPRWRTAAILKTVKLPYVHNVWPLLAKFGTVTHIGPLQGIDH